MPRESKAPKRLLSYPRNPRTCSREASVAVGYHLREILGAAWRKLALPQWQHPDLRKQDSFHGYVKTLLPSLQTCQKISLS